MSFYIGDIMDKVRGRFAPSPTGEMHLGNAWTALLAWLQTRSLNGTMVLRIEDLDPDRSRPEYTDQLLADLRWLGLDWDEGPDVGGDYGPYCQDERRQLYQQALEGLLKKGLVYPCYCTRAEIQAAASAPHVSDGEAAYPGLCRNIDAAERDVRTKQGRKPALRIMAPSGDIEFTDLLYGLVKEDISKTCGDFTVRRSDGVHAYQLAVVVDDAAMKISHVLRGDDLLGSTPRQLYLYQLIGAKPPCFTHVPLLYSPDGNRLSKRQKDLSLAAIKARGVSACQIIGFLAWKARLIDRQYPLSARELIPLFFLDKLPREPVIVDSTAEFLLENLAPPSLWAQA